MRQIILFSLMCILINCTTSKMLFAQHYDNNVKLIISTHENAVSDTLMVTGFIKNDSKKDFYFHKSKPSVASKYRWRLDVFYQDTIRMTDYTLTHYGRTSITHYFLLKSNECYTFTFNVIISELMPETQYYRKLNDIYGEYSIKLTYYNRDRYFRHRKVFRGRIESNVLNVVYKP